MIIKLKNITQYENFTLEIPDTGVVRLYGESGIGKSTIFNAIEHALYGSVPDLTTWGAKSSSIDLLLTKINTRVVRTSGPGTLTVYCASGDTLKDDEAQEFINSVMGMNEQEFGACSYIRQGMDNSLLSLGAADQLRFIESLSISDYNPDRAKEKIKILVKESESDLQTKMMIEKQIREVVRDNYAKIASLEASLGTKPVLSLKPHDVESKSEYSVEHRALIEKSKEQLLTVQKSIADPIYDLIKTGEAEIAKQEEQVRVLQGVVDQAKEEASNLKPWPLKTSIESYAELKNLLIQESVINTKIKMRAIYTEITQEYKDVTEHGSLTNMLVAKKDALKRTISVMLDTKASHVSKRMELSSLSIPQYCPKCRVPLSVITGKIIAADDVPPDLQSMKDTLSQTIVALATEITSTEAQSDKVSSWLTKCLTLKDSLPAVEPLPEIKTLEECRDSMNSLNKYIQDSIASENRLKDIDISIFRNINTIRQSQSAIIGLKGKLEKSKDLPTMDQLIAERSETTEIIHNLNTECQRVNNELNSYQQEVKALESFEKIELLLNDLKSEAIAADKRLLVAVQEVGLATERFSAAVRLKELSDFAAVAAIDSKLDDINACSAFFIEKMFSEDGTVIKLKNSATTKKGEERAKFSTEIFHKGKYAKKLSNLSGGEKSRAYLAFQLGLSELYKSPMLLIDEGFAGLGDKDKNQCLEILHDIVKDKLVLVIEHGAGSSHFDATINIG